MNESKAKVNGIPHENESTEPERRPSRRDKAGDFFIGRNLNLLKFWFPYFRLHAPTEAYFDHSWPLPDIEKLK